MSEFDLDGIDGGNPLGFMAAIGTLATAGRAFGFGVAKLSWTARLGAWRPGLHLERDITRADLVDGLHEALQGMSDHPAFDLGDDLSLACDVFRGAALDAQRLATPTDRGFADAIAAFGSESVESTIGGKPTGKIADTAFRTMNGSGHQHFLGSIRTFVRDTTAAHLSKALFEQWRYDDPLENHSMRWDPMDDVRYALRWRKPSGDPERKRSGSVWGANRLAIEALALFPTAPANAGLRTTGFSARRGSGVFWTWPIWSGQLDLDAIRSVLALTELQTVDPDRAALLPRGVVEVYRCQRITQGKFRNFGSARPV